MRSPEAKHPEDAEIVNLLGTYQLLPIPAKSAGTRVELDLGCGSGSFTAELARRYPERSVLAADLMIGRLRKLVKKARREGLNNLTAYRSEARHLVALALPDGSLDRIHLLCPDPWPKDRHRGHRLMASDFTFQVWRVLKAGGVFHFSSDDEPYFEAVTRVMAQSGLFDEAEPDPELNDIKSDFEKRWLEAGKTVRHVYYNKRSAGASI